MPKTAWQEYTDKQLEEDKRRLKEWDKMRLDELVKLRKTHALNAYIQKRREDIYNRRRNS